MVECDAKHAEKYKIRRKWWGGGGGVEGVRERERRFLRSRPHSQNNRLSTKLDKLEEWF